MADTWLHEMPTAMGSVHDLSGTIGQERVHALELAAQQLRSILRGRRILNINSSGSGGGAAEMLRDLVPYVRGQGIDCRWLVIDGDPGFFDITKRIHNRIYGFPGDDGSLGEGERQYYERTHAAIGRQLSQFTRPDDIVMIHDPQPLGLIPALRESGLRVIWRCHVGTDQPNEYTKEAWEFVRPYLEDLDGYVFHRACFAPQWLDPNRVWVIPPSIGPLSAKNRHIDPADARLIVSQCGLRQGESGGDPISFIGRDGKRRWVGRHADILQSGPPIPADVPFVVQVSRWDPMKDMAGVMTAFADCLSELSDAHLALIGPAVSGTADDPTGALVLLDCMSAWRKLPYQARARIHLACLPMADLEENAFTVNAIQREADIIIQKSLSEGFGLTVAEAMWKSRPVIAGAVGGIQDQITPGAGVLVAPNDLDGLAGAITYLLAEPERRKAVGEAAHARVRSHFLPDRHLLQYAGLLTSTLGSGS